jgi:hypothetical protein
MPDLTLCKCYSLFTRSRHYIKQPRAGCVKRNTDPGPATGSNAGSLKNPLFLFNCLLVVCREGWPSSGILPINSGNISYIPLVASMVLVSSQAWFFRPSLIIFTSDCFKKLLQNAAMRKFFALSEIKIMATYPKSHT